jgi:hypothetical protein
VVGVDPAGHCTGCGHTAPDCPSGGRCRGTFEPPRYCPACGRRLRVVIIPTGWTARCRDHGPVPADADSRA